MEKLRSLLRAVIDAMPFALVGVYSLLCIVALVALMGMYFSLAVSAIAFASPVIAAGIIWLLTHRLNRRDDPRDAEWPTDTP